MKSSVKKTGVITTMLLVGGLSLSVSAGINNSNSELLGSGHDVRTNILNVPGTINFNENKCGEGKCGTKEVKDTTSTKTNEAKCGEGKCGSKDNNKESTESKTTESKCGEGKCGSK
ncbi:MAG: hypothetical protein KAG96_04600 [Ichthyobacteriaceae bacterium]|nr:hypothetical protein [Ichthyobacteriaceae bacterium]